MPSTRRERLKLARSDSRVSDTYQGYRASACHASHGLDRIPRIIPVRRHFLAGLHPRRFAGHLRSAYVLLAMLTCVNAGRSPVPCGKLSGENSPVFITAAISRLRLHPRRRLLLPRLTTPAVIGLQSAYSRKVAWWTPVHRGVSRHFRCSHATESTPRLTTPPPW